MAAAAPVLYQETRISLPTPAPSSTLRINTAHSKALVSFGAGRKRSHDEISGLDEEGYARKCLATEGSVHFRPADKFPRSLLWRVLNDRQLLEVQSVDLIRNRADASRTSRLTFHIEFPDKIIPGGVALADAESKDGLEIFVLTTGSDLYTISLRRDMLLRETIPPDFDTSTLVKKYSSGSFSYKHPYRLVASSSLDLLVSLHDGSMLRLTREVTDNGTQWRETHFSEGGWSGTLKRSFPVALYKQRTERYGNIDLFSDAIAAIARSPSRDNSTEAGVVWTVSLDHQLKAWDLGTGKVLSRSDLTESDELYEDNKKHGRYMMSPEQGTLMQIVTLPKGSGSRKLRGHDDALYWIVAHSPKDHQFKFYAIKDNPSTVDSDVPLIAHDVQPRVKLIPPVDELMETNIWHLEQFAVKPGSRWEGTQLWIRARTGAICKTLMLTFDLLDQGSEHFDIETDFRLGWSVVDSSSQSIEQARESLDFNRLDPAVDGEATASEKWVDFLFFPGRFSEISLETALHIYRKGRNISAAANKSLHAREEPLKERIVTSISAKIILGRLPNDQPDYDGYQHSLQEQWNHFFQILSHLHKRRCESIGFALDPHEGLPWTICADYIAPVRTCTEFERMSLNANLVMNIDVAQLPQQLRERSFLSANGDDDDDGFDEDSLRKGRVMEAARQLRSYFSAMPQEKMRTIALSNALDATAEWNAEDVLQMIYEDCNFQDEVRNEDYDALNDSAESFGGLLTLDVDSLLMVLESTEDDPKALGTDHGESLARYGEYMTSTIVRESYQRTEAVLLDVLALTVLLHCDLEEVSADFRAGEVYDAIIMRLRNNELRRWLVANVRPETVSTPTAVGELRSLYECMFAQDFEPKPDRKHATYGLPEMLTGWSKHWAHGLNLADWGGITEHILADLLKHKEYDYALDFEKFLTDTPFTSYLRGRLYIAVGQYALASQMLERVVEEMSTQGCPKSSLLSDEEVNYFGKGAVYYLQHISSLFEKLKIFSYVADLTGLALSQINEIDLEAALFEVDKRKSLKDSPVKQKLSDNIEEVRILKLKQARDELLNRRFNALVQTGHFEQAFETLQQIKNPPLVKSSMQQLLKACIDRNAVSTLLQLPITGDLASEADSILLQLAKKNMASGLPSGPQYQQILFAFRTQQSNFRGAAAILYEHMEHLQKTKRMMMQDPEDETLIRIYVLLINTLSCCGEDEAWLLADPIPGVHEVGRKRKLVTLEDVRREYTRELDRRSDVLQGRFPVVGGAEGDEMDLF